MLPSRIDSLTNAHNERIVVKRKPSQRAQPSKSRETIIADRVIAVTAPPNWDEMTKDDPAGPEVQAFLHRMLEQYLAGVPDPNRIEVFKGRKLALQRTKIGKAKSKSGLRRESVNGQYLRKRKRPKVK
jgi:hypothetical protein